MHGPRLLGVLNRRPSLRPRSAVKEDDATQNKAVSSRPRPLCWSVPRAGRGARLTGEAMCCQNGTESKCIPRVRPWDSTVLGPPPASGWRPPATCLHGSRRGELVMAACLLNCLISRSTSIHPRGHERRGRYGGRDRPRPAAAKTTADALPSSLPRHFSRLLTHPLPPSSLLPPTTSPTASMPSPLSAADPVLLYVLGATTPPQPTSVLRPPSASAICRKSSAQPSTSSPGS